MSSCAKGDYGDNMAVDIHKQKDAYNAKIKEYERLPASKNIDIMREQIKSEYLIILLPEN